MIAVPEFDLFLLAASGLLAGLISWSVEKDNDVALFENLTAGIAGSVLGYYVFGYFGFGYGGGMLEVMLCAMIGSIVFLLIAGLARQW